MADDPPEDEPTPRARETPVADAAVPPIAAAEQVAPPLAPAPVAAHTSSPGPAPPKKSSIWKGLWSGFKFAVGAGVTIAGVAFVGMQLRENWRQAQLGYLQQRSQDFLEREFQSRETLSCIYDWWYSEDAPVPNDLATRCQRLAGETQIYAETMLYVEEALMYFVEEARVTCQNNVSYSRELDIWRNDVREDVSGVFSFYMLYRFAAPEMHSYFNGLPLTEDTPTGRLSAFVRLAKIPGMSISGICRRADNFRAMMLIPLAPEPDHVRQICRGEPSNLVLYRIGQSSRPNYCPDVHGVRPLFGGFFGG
jgi:hypothetical protein